MKKRSPLRRPKSTEKGSNAPLLGVKLTGLNPRVILLLGTGKRFQNAGRPLSMLRGVRMSGVLAK
jgi:hypothetical protein